MVLHDITKPIPTLTLEQYRRLSEEDARRILTAEYGGIGKGTDPHYAETPTLATYQGDNAIADVPTVPAEWDAYMTQRRQQWAA